MTASPCSPCPPDRRKRFWATQADACGAVVDGCGPCALPGLKFVDTIDVAGVITGRTIENDNWIAGLALNILHTDSRKPDRECGYRCGERGGHWADAFRKDNRTSGSDLTRQKINCATDDSVQAAISSIKVALEKMIRAGVASKINVTARYAGNRTVKASIEIIGIAGDITRVGTSGVRLKNAWAWGVN